MRAARSTAWSSTTHHPSASHTGGEFVDLRLEYSIDLLITLRSHGSDCLVQQWVMRLVPRAFG
jgi:hypothetical protein